MPRSFCLALLVLGVLAAPAAARPGDSLAVARQAAAAERAGHVSYWLKGKQVFAEKWVFAAPKGLGLARADRLRAKLARGAKPLKTLPFGHGVAGGVTYTYPGGLVITSETLLDKISGRYDHVLSLFVAPDGSDELSLNERHDLVVVR